MHTTGYKKPLRGGSMQQFRPIKQKRGPEGIPIILGRLCVDQAAPQIRGKMGSSVNRVGVTSVPNETKLRLIFTLHHTSG